MKRNKLVLLNAGDALHQHKPVDESVLLQLKGSKEMADKNSEKLSKYHAVRGVI